jgi:hypothetical protein
MTSRSHVSAGFEKEAHDVTTGLAILSSLEVIRDRCATAERRREFAELLFSRVTVDQYSRTRDWALNNPFQRLFEFAQPGSKLVLDGDPERVRGRKYHQPSPNTPELPGELNS